MSVNEKTTKIEQVFSSSELDLLEQSLQEYDYILLEKLLKDKTTGHNIKWGTNDYEKNGVGFKINQEIFPDLVTGMYSKVIQPRVAKSAEEQQRRTKLKAEVFTPAWLCNKQNNIIDSLWFGRKNVFNHETDDSWVVNSEIITFPNIKGKTWQDYIEDTRLEITCGEAPYLVSRYDSVTGDILPILSRIGMLDRKLRIVGENTSSREEWLHWTEIALKNVYGYDYQGDNVLLARENLLYTYIDYYREKFSEMPEKTVLRKIANIISWNIWQMDGISMTVPFTESQSPKQMTLDMFIELNEADENLINIYENKDNMPCRIMDWRANKSIEFKSLVKEKR